MPDHQHIPDREDRAGAVRAVQLEGLGFGPDILQDEPAATLLPRENNEADAGKTRPQRSGAKLAEQAGAAARLLGDSLTSLLAEGSEPYAV